MDETNEPQPGTSSQSSIRADEDDNLRDIFKDASATTDMDSKKWIPQLRDKIEAMLRTPLKQEFNSEVYKCIFQLCLFKKRFTWLCSDSTRGWTHGEAKRFSFIARLSLNELHIVLPRLKQHLISGDQVDMEEGKVMYRPASPEEYQQFGIHLMILEDTIQSLVRDQEDTDSDRPTIFNAIAPNKLTDSMEPNELKSLLERMKEVLVEVFDYLELVHKQWAQLVDKPTSLQFCASQGALRIALVWVSEDIGSFAIQCNNFLIDLIIKYLLVIDLLPDTMPDLLIMALDAICMGGEDEGDTMKQQLRKTSQFREALQKYLDFIQSEQQNKIDDEQEGSRNTKRRKKEFKFRCSIVRDLLKNL